MDATLIERVLYNLLENAGKYTPPGTVVTLAAETVGPDLEVTVSDRGPGIPAGQEEIIFEKFTRGARESATPGVGLGLAISRAIVEAHRGRIWAENNLGGGAKFSFTLAAGNAAGRPDGTRRDGRRVISWTPGARLRYPRGNAGQCAANPTHDR